MQTVGGSLTSSVSQERRAQVKFNVVKGENIVLISGLNLRKARMLIVSRVKYRN